MARSPRRYRLLIYEHMLNRWWPATLTLSLALFLYVGVLWGTEWYFTDPTKNPLPRLSTVGGTAVLAIAGLVLLFTIFLITVRRFAYVQVFPGYLRLVTPFLRLNVSHKRIQSTNSAEMSGLFPPKSLSSWRRDIIRPLGGETAIVVHLTSYPMPRGLLLLFLSPFFFYDKTPHFVLLVNDWLRLSTELESARTSARMPKKPSPPRITSGLLDDLKRK